MKKVKIIILFQFLFLLIGFHSNAANYYVNDADNTGDRWCTDAGAAYNAGTNPGTSTSTSVLTLLEILTNYDLGAGDIVYIDHGTYSWTGINWATSASDDYGTGTGASVLTIQGAGVGGTWTTDITSSSGTLFNFPDNSDTYDYITFDGLKMTAASTADVFYLAQPDYITVSNSTLVATGAGSVGFHTFNAATNCTLTRCDLRVTSSATRAIHVEQGAVCTDLTIERNHIDGVNGSEASYGVYDDQGASNFVCKNNFFSNLLTGVYRSQDRAGAVLYNNSFYTKNYCVYMDEATISTVLKNNIFYCYGAAGGDYPLYLNTASNFTGSNINYNLYYTAGSNVARWNATNYTSVANWNGSTNAPEANGTSGDPGYTTPTACNLSIGSGSPAANAGVTGLVTNDITSGGTRANPPEIGAFEVGSLPITLLSFDANCNNNQLEFNWSTASEINNDFFTIEQSKDNNNWEISLMTKGAGNSNQILTYSEVEENPSSGISYYRLKQTDFDGRHEYSKAIAVNCNSIESDISIFPNPSEGHFHILFSGKKDEIHSLEITNAIGQSVYYSKELISDINLSKQATGTYILRLHLNNAIIFKKIEIIK